MLCSLILASALGAIQQRIPLTYPMSKSEEIEKFHTPAVTGMSQRLRLQEFEKRMDMERSSTFQKIMWRSVGSEHQGGRVVDVDSPASKPNTLYISYASGGLWRTEDDGITWTSLFDFESSFAIGDTDVSDDGQTIWVGTGENNSARTNYSGTGVFKSVDRGATWQHMGLEETHRIGRVEIHPSDPDTVFVAANGALYSQSAARGVYRTTDGGETWEHVLAIDEWTGVIDLAIDPSDPDRIFAAAWHRDRRAWNMLESGPGSALYLSEDGGDSWSVVEGLPSGDAMGRTGVAFSQSDPNVVYVYIDNQSAYEDAEWADERVPDGKLTAWRLRRMSDGLLKQVTEEELKEFLRNKLPDDSDVDDVIEKIKDGEMGVVELGELLLEENPNLYALRITNSQVWRSDDGGRKWELVSPTVGSMLGYYCGRVTVHPENPDELYITGTRLLKSVDGGKSWESIAPRNHVDRHVYWIDDRNPKRMIDGNDGGAYLSMDGGESWRHLNNVPVGQYTTIAVDNKSPYNIYGGLQDNGTIKGPSTYRQGIDPITRWQGIAGGDGSAIAVDPRNDGDIVYVASQFGSHSAIDQAEGRRWSVRPSGRGLRFNWISPIVISKHHPDIIYIGSQFVHRSFNQGRKWEAISPDLTKGLPRGDVPFSTLTALDESPFKFGVIYAGADDGSIHVTKDGGVTWDAIPTEATERWVTRIVASKHDEATVYCTQNGYRQDEWEPYVWRSTDYGKTWESIVSNLPFEPVNTIREDPDMENVLYVGTDMGVFFSMDSGESWQVYGGGLPHVPVHDLVIQEREREMVVATHARSVWIIDVEPIADLTDEVLGSDLYIWEVDSLRFSERWGFDRKQPWDKSEPREPEVDGRFWSRDGGEGSLRVLDSDGKAVVEQELSVTPGFNFFTYGLQLKARESAEPKKIEKPKTLQEALADPYSRPSYLPPGDYTIEITVGDTKQTVEWEIRD